MLQLVKCSCQAPVDIALGEKYVLFLKNFCHSYRGTGGLTSIEWSMTKKLQMNQLQANHEAFRCYRTLFWNSFRVLFMYSYFAVYLQDFRNLLCRFDCMPTFKIEKNWIFNHNPGDIGHYCTYQLLFKTILYTMMP